MLHSKSVLSVGFEGDAFRIFRLACLNAGGTPPAWSENDCNDPASWHAPSDAAGGLILWNSDGSLNRLEPSTPETSYKEDSKTAEQTLMDLRFHGGSLGVVRATYASSGGRVVALCQSYGKYFITVCRMDGEPRFGGTEAAIKVADPDAKIYLLTLSSN